MQRCREPENGYPRHFVPSWDLTVLARYVTELNLQNSQNAIQKSLSVLKSNEEDHPAGWSVTQKFAQRKAVLGGKMPVGFKFRPGCLTLFFCGHGSYNEAISPTGRFWPRASFT